MADDDEGTAAGIFSECTIAFVTSSHLAPKLIGNLTSVLEENGATVLEPDRNGQLRIKEASHIVSNTIEFPQYTDSQAFMIPVVTTHWITTSIMRRKQAQVRPFSPDPRMIFSEVVVTCADLPVSDKESILGATMALGGQASKDATRLTTHICALTMEHPKIAAALARKWKGKVVLPHWFDDCFKLGKKIDEAPYLLPDPEILKKKADDDLDIPCNDNLVGASSTNPEFSSLHDDGGSHGTHSRPPVTVFQNKSILLGSDLQIHPRLHAIIKDIIVHGGGRLVEDVDDCDTLICQHRDGEQYVRAARSCKEIGNLSWLYFLIVHNEWAAPMKRLLHYPTPRDGVPGFKDMRITVSNYGGEARIYLENLIKACGAEYTRTMKADNTHLITARDSSEKCKAAPEWGILVVNHLWIEESYAACEVKPVNTKKYNHFPPRTNLGEIIGQTFLEEAKLKALYYPGGEEGMSVQAKRKRKILDAAGQNAYLYGPAEGVVIGEVARDEDEENQNPTMDKGKGKAIATAKGKGKGKGKRALALETPLRPRRTRGAVSAQDEGEGEGEGEGEEEEEEEGEDGDGDDTPSAGGRSAKAKARDRLQSIAPDIALYEKEKKRGGAGKPFGGKRAADLAEREKERSSPLRSGEAEDGRPSKKARSSLPHVEMRIILTGFTRWVGDRQQEDQDRRKLRDLGIQIVQEGQPCDYLAAPHIVRTVKFLCALARGPTIISSTFISACLESNALLEPSAFPLRDAATESKFAIDLDTSVARARANRGKLLRGVPVYCTETIPKGPESYRAIAEANGALFKIYRARSGTTIKPTTAEEDGGEAPEPVYLLSGTGEGDRAVWGRFGDMARRGHMEPRVVAPDWLLDVAMAQRVRFDEKFLLE